MTDLKNALVPFSETGEGSQSAMVRTICIRQHVAKALTDQEVWDSITPYLTPVGISGSRQFDHAMVAKLVYEASEELQAFEHLPLVSVWKHTETVIKKRGYHMSGGYIVGMVGDDDIEEG